MIDYIVAILLFYYFLRGWSNGLVRILLGPIALIIGSAVSYIYYIKTQHFLMSLAIGLISPIIFNIIFSIVHNSWQKKKGADEPFFSLARLLGGTINLLWKGSLLAVVIILIIIIPLRIPWFEKIQDDVLLSKSYKLLYSLAGSKMPATTDRIKTTMQTLQDPKAIEKIRSNKTYQSLVDDKTMKEFLADEELVKQLRNKDFSRIIASPKFQNILKDDALIKKILDLNKVIMSQDQKDAKETEE